MAFKNFFGAFALITLLFFSYLSCQGTNFNTLAEPIEDASGIKIGGTDTENPKEGGFASALAIFSCRRMESCGVRVELECIELVQKGYDLSKTVYPRETLRGRELMKREQATEIIAHQENADACITRSQNMGCTSATSIPVAFAYLSGFRECQEFFVP